MNFPKKKTADAASPMRLFEQEGSHRPRLLFFCFLIPALLLFLIYAAMQVFPFGENSVLVLDLNAQYVYYFAELRDKILSGGSLLYSWNRSLGGEFMGMFAYYLASPFSALVALFPLSAITEALLTIMLLKSGLSGLTMGLFLSRTRPKAKGEVVLFSVLYAVSSYAVVQCHNTMWIDELIYLPLIMMGIEKIITERRYLLYTLSLTLAVMCNYYIGYMICLFSFLYFFYAYFSREEGRDRNPFDETHHFLRSFLRIALFSLLALGMALVVLYPAYYSLTFGKTEFSDPTFSFIQNFDFLDMIAKTLPGAYDTVRPEGIPFLFCGTLTVLLLPAYFCCKTVSRREKIAGLLFLGVMIFCMNISAVDIFWHGLQKPNWLNGRYSFMVCFLLIVFAFKALDGLESVRFRVIGVTASLLALLVIVMQKVGVDFADDMKVIWLTLGLLLIYSIFVWLAREKQLRSAGITMMTLVVLIETFLSGYFNLMALDDDVVYSSRTGWIKFLDRFQDKVEAIQLSDETPFYRMEKEFHRKTNDNMVLDMNGISSSTSTLNASVIKLLKSMGYASKSHWSKYLGGTPVADSLLGIKYILYGEEPDKLIYRQLDADEKDLVWTYQNDYALSLGYCSSSEIRSLSPADYDSPFVFLNDMVSALIGERTEMFCALDYDDPDPVNLDVSFTSGHLKYTPINAAKKTELTFLVPVPAGREIYAYFPSSYKRECDLTVNGTSRGTVFGNETDRIQYLGVYDEDTTIAVSLELNDDVLYLMRYEPFFYSLDGDAFKAAMTTLGEGNLILDRFEDTHLHGTVTVPDDKPMLFTTIPYDEGWILTVDGEKTPLIRSLDALLSAELTPGTHTVELVYRPACFTVGLIGSITCLALFIIVCTADAAAERRRRAERIAAIPALQNGEAR